MVISLGGGSALDIGKAVAVLLTNPGEIYDYLEVVGKGKGLTHSGLPFIAIPTTAGTGSEVTRNAVLGAEVPEKPGEFVKVSLRSAFMLPRLALVDPELTFSLPPNITAATGMDALTQLIEPFLSNKANPLTDGICREGIVRVARSLPAAVRQGDNSAARSDMSIASLFGGLALANAKLGAVHGFAAPIGGLFHAPHGAICARLLPIVMQMNYRALLQRDPEGAVLGRFAEVARLLTGNPAATAQDAVNWLTDLSSDLNIQGLASYGITSADLERLAGLAAKASSMQGNPIKLSNGELIEILALAL
jgi:alcohol dehydrogenase class IV